jgi:hypothetical protein
VTYTEQGDLLALAAALEARDEAFNSLDDTDRSQWERSVIQQAIRTVAARGHKFSANDVRELLPDVNRNRIGREFARAASDGVIEWAGMERSTDKGTHGHRINVWVRSKQPYFDELASLRAERENLR